MPRVPAVLLAFCLPVFAANENGSALFQKNCAICHKPNNNRTPLPETLGQMPKQAILAALDTGAMKAQGALLSAAEREAIAGFLTAGHVASTEPATRVGACPEAAAPLKNLTGWNGWGVDLLNTRFQPAKLAGLSASQVPNLKLKWAFGFAGVGVTYGQPTIADGRLFFGSADGTVYSIDAGSGCIYWTFKAPATVRTAISLGPIGARTAAYFGDVKAFAYAVDARTGELLWKYQVDDHPAARVTGAPKLYDGRLYVPVSSIEEVSGGSPKYVCCKFRGSVVALDASTGKQLWKTYAIPDAPSPSGQNSEGVDRFGPSGAAIWSSPTIDVQRKLLYVGTGDQYSDPPTKYSDAVIALDLETGSMKWAQQLTPNDGWNFACVNPNKANCPEHSGPDIDIGASPVLMRAGGKDVLVVGQKSGMLHGLDPEKRGDILWEVRIGKGGALGGIMWGLAADGKNVYAPLSDFSGRKNADGTLSGGGLFAIDPATGGKVWGSAPVTPACAGKPGCSPAQMAPATAIPGVVFSGSMDGHLRAYSTTDGAILWDYDTLRDYDTVNGVKAKGGSMSATGPTIANGMLFVSSGYGALGGMNGNVLLAFSQ